jgi:signal transduction histidine kinase
MFSDTKRHPMGPARFNLTVVLSFAALVLGFALSTLAATWLSNSISSQAEALALDALPSIGHLNAACDALRDLEAAADDYPDLAPELQPRGRATIDDAARKVDTELATYLTLPAFRGELDLYESRVPPAIRELTTALGHLYAQVDGRDTAGARVTADREVRSAANMAAQGLRALVRVNATEAYQQVDRISMTHRNASVGAFILDGCAIVLAIGAGFWVLRRFREYDTMVQGHAALVQGRADELEMFGKRVAHDLLSPLSALTYCLAAFKRPSEADPKLKDALARARACTVRAQRMVDGIFEFARAGGRPEAGARADVHGVLEQVCEEATLSALAVRAAGRGEAPDVVVEPFGNVAVACSTGVLGSILGNLVSNATKYMSDSAEKRITVRVQDRADGVRVEVEDTGPGVPHALEGRIFDPYVRADGVTQSGLGLGLATVKRLCEAHGGAVGVRSTPGRGSVFWFRLPKATVAESGATPVAASLRRIS